MSCTICTGFEMLLRILRVHQRLFATLHPVSSSCCRPRGVTGPLLKILVRRCLSLGMFQLYSIIEFIHSKVTCSKEVLKLNMTFDKGTAKRQRRKACVNSILSYLTQVAFQYPSTLKIFRQSILNKALFEYSMSNVRYCENTGLRHRRRQLQQLGMSVAQISKPSHR